LVPDALGHHQRHSDRHRLLRDERLIRAHRLRMSPCANTRLEVKKI
jgi:hypothetical protein